MERETKLEALRRSFGAGRKTIRWVEWGIGGAVVVGIIVLLAAAHFRFFAFGQLWIWVFKGAAALGTGLGVKLGARRARRTVRELPDVEAVQILRPIAEVGDEADRRLAAELMKGLHPEGTELVASEAPGGRGTEVAVEGPPPPETPARLGPA